MADTIKSGSDLLIECLFLDGDTRTITLKNPRNDLTSTNIENLETFIQTENIIIGDRDGSDFRKIKRAVKRNTTKCYLDLEL